MSEQYLQFVPWVLKNLNL